MFPDGDVVFRTGIHVVDGHHGDAVRSAATNTSILWRPELV